MGLFESLRFEGGARAGRAPEAREEGDRALRTGREPAEGDRAARRDGHPRRALDALPPLHGPLGAGHHRRRGEGDRAAAPRRRGRGGGRPARAFVREQEDGVAWGLARARRDRSGRRCSRWSCASSSSSGASYTRDPEKKLVLLTWLREHHAGARAADRRGRAPAAPRGLLRRRPHHRPRALADARARRARARRAHRSCSSATATTRASAARCSRRSPRSAPT